MLFFLFLSLYHMVRQEKNITEFNEYLCMCLACIMLRYMKEGQRKQIVQDGMIW